MFVQVYGRPEGRKSVGGNISGQRGGDFRSDVTQKTLVIATYCAEWAHNKCHFLYEKEAFLTRFLMKLSEI
jgi:hypothetical protein